MKNFKKYFFVLLLILPVSFFAHAKRTTINFEDQLIEGQAQNPDLLIMLKKKKFNYKKLIRLRENFLPELKKSANDLLPSRKKRGSK